MGREIALVAAIAGSEVWCVDAFTESLRAAQTYADEHLRNQVQKGKMEKSAVESSLSRLHYAEGLEEALSCVEFTSEAITEHRAL